MKNFSAFTLSEVLITLGIIGVVAAITMPSLIANINDRVNSERQANIALKVTQAMEKMKALGKLNENYDSTESFVNELQKHLKVAKICNSSNIADCWPTQKVTAGDGKEYEVSKFKTGKNIGLVSSTTNNVGVVLADGGAFILNYNPSAKPLDIGDPVVAFKKSLPIGGGKSKLMAYSTSVTAGIDFVMDVNGTKGPNRENIGNKWGDIRSFKAANFSGCPGFMLEGVGCVVDLSSSYSPVQVNEYEYACACFADMPCNCPEPPKVNNYYLGAIQACTDYDMHLANSSEIGSIQAQYGKVEGVPESGQYWVQSSSSSWISSTNGQYVSGHRVHTFSAPVSINDNELEVVTIIRGGGPAGLSQDEAPNGVLCVGN